MSSAEVQYRVAHGIVRLTLAQPDKLNAMTFAMWSSLPDLVARADADPSVRVIVLEGDGERAFCAGADISQFGAARTGDEAVASYDRAVEAGNRAVASAGKPTVARIRGVCFGGGFGLAMMCDLRLSAEGSRFRIPAARLGLGYGLSSVRTLVQRLGFATTADLLMSARIVGAAEAERLGIVNRTWPAAAFDGEADAYLAMIASNAPLTLKALKRALVELARPEAERDAASVEALVAACFRSSDYREGQAAFRERREPSFHGD